MERGQFTFYRSFWDAAKNIPKSYRLSVLEAIIEYALDGKEPKLSGSSLAIFLLVKPNLDSASKKAANGKNGGKSDKQTGSKPEANRKQTGSKQEANDKQSGSKKEKEKEKEIEIEGEKEYECTPLTPSSESEKANSFLLDYFHPFWEAYPTNTGGMEAAKEAWEMTVHDYRTVEKIMMALSIFQQSKSWTEKDGKFIPGAVKFLTERLWEKPPVLTTDDMPKGASGQLGEAELEAIRKIMEKTE